MTRSAIAQSFLATEQGRRWFPEGNKDPRFIIVNSFLGFIQKAVVRSVSGTVPTSDHRGDADAQTLGR
jgi:hypothetical protein